MRISEGNIFEAMRLVLPEHRERMRRFEREIHKTERVALAPEKQEDINCILKTAIRNGQLICVTIFDPYESESLTGLPAFRNGKLYLTNEAGVHEISLTQVMDVEEV